MKTSKNTQNDGKNVLGKSRTTLGTFRLEKQKLKHGKNLTSRVNQKGTF